MPFVKGMKANKQGGRKTKAEEVRKYLSATLDLGLVNSIMNEELDKVKAKRARNHEEVKDFVVPFALKAIVAKSQADITVKTPKPLDDMSDIVANVAQKK